MWTEKPPGVKILWIWTIGTAVILLTSSVRNRLKDMEKIVNSEQKMEAAVDSAIVVDAASSDEAS